ncbi:hypothetical protein C8R44DRAFT_760575 [Mycena epipterygia]|nr:hypothetical protein C8R44DRAFT_760575 [Mycena epipterygia]
MRISLSQCLKPLRLRRASGTPRGGGTRAAETLSSPMSVYLPVELQFLVLDEISDENLELRKLSLICRAWAAHSQRIIFQDVWVSYTTVRRLLALFHTSPHLGAYVHTLRVVEGATFLSDAQIAVPVLERLVERLADMMPNVRTLDLLYRKFGPDVTRVECSADALIRITHLRIRSGIFTTADNMLRFIALFPRLDALEILGHYTIIARPSTAPPPPPRHLRYLALGRVFCSGIVIAWLASGTVRVDDLRISSWGHDNTPLDSFLIKIGGGLQRLHLQEVRSLERSMSIPSCPSLRHLEIDLRFSTADRRSMEAGLLPVLHQLASPHLTTMYFDTYVVPGYLDLPWDAVDAALAGFGALREVVFELYGQFDMSGGLKFGHPTYAELCEGMKRQMALADARGILKFKCAGGDNLLTSDA